MKKLLTIDSNQNTTTEQDTKSEEEKQLEADMKELEAIGDIEVFLTVSITVPADLSEGATQESLDADAGTQYISAKLNDDGSVTFKFTKLQYRAMIHELTASFEGSLQKMVDDAESTFASIEHNSDFTEFNAHLDGEEVGLLESFGGLAFVRYGRMYGIFRGKTPDNIAINYYGASGTLLKTLNSSDMSYKSN